MKTNTEGPFKNKWKTEVLHDSREDRGRCIKWRGLGRDLFCEGSQIFVDVLETLESC